jgi:hypothetical protein
VTIGGITNYFATISEAFASIPANSTAIVMAQAMTFVETPDLNTAVVISPFTGGYDSGFTSAGGVTTIQGGLVISNGSIEINNLVIM